MPHTVTGPKISVVIVCWNNQDLLEECYASIYAQTYTNWEVILVDNGSKDGSVEYTKKHHPKVRLIETGANLGFAVANNIGIKDAFKDPECKYIMLLNTDARVREDWLEKIVAFAEDHPKGFSYQSPTLDYYNHDVLDSCGILIDQQALATQMGYRQTNVKLKTMQVFGVNAAACLYSRAFLDAQPFGDDYFDHDFFMYLEDVDIATRAVMMGWESWFVNESEAYHMGSASSGKNPGFSMYMTYKNNALVLTKNLPARIIIKVLPGLLRAELHRLRGFAREGKYSLIKVIIKGRFESIALIPEMLRKRKQLKKYWAISEAKLWAMMKNPKLPKIPASERAYGGETVTAILVSHNDMGTLKSSVEALVNQTYANLRIIIVDNGSTDGSTHFLDEKYPSVTLLSQTANLGVANAFNVGLTKALLDEPDYFAFIQANTIVAPDWVETMVGTMRSQPEAFAVTSKLLTHTTEGDLITLGQGYDYHPVLGPRAVKFEDTKTREVFAASDYASFYRTDSLGPVGMMDGDFFDGLEDVDFCFRGRLNGGEVYSNPKATAVVKVPESTRKYRWYHNQKNRYFIYIKNMPFKLFWRFMPAMLLNSALIIGKSFNRGLFPQQLKAALKGAARTPRMLRYRRRINIHRSVTAAGISKAFVKASAKSR
jgi:GT2 family glycosyltransferase